MIVSDPSALLGDGDFIDIVFDDSVEQIPNGVTPSYAESNAPVQIMPQKLSKIC